GLSHGRLRTGACGHPNRRTFACLGDAVNVAARLMSNAPPGAIYASDNIRLGTGDRFAWSKAGDLALKGRTEPVAVQRLAGTRAPQSGVPQSRLRPLVGRARELAQLTALVGDAHRERRGRVIGLAGDAGIGKSRLLAALAEHAGAGGFTFLAGSA